MADACSVKVALRVRPLAKYELNKGCKDILDVQKVNQEQILIRGTDKAFAFNYVLESTSSQDELYTRCVQNMIENLFKGYNVTILAYGQTGSGKTHSMGTTYKGEGEMGVIPRAITDIFNYVKDHFSVDFTVTVSFMELYQEVLYDLLSDKPRDQCVMEIREDIKLGIHIPSLTEIPVNSAKEVLDTLAKGSVGRATGCTNMNSQSSRSHAIFTVTIAMQNKDDPTENKTAKLHLVDLAGSERPKKTGAVGNTFKEGVNINKGLFVLGNVISCLGDEKQQHGFIPYRDSNLTRLLKDSLGGNSITLMIACVSPADYNLEETISTLRYADRARKIKNKPIVNQDSKQAEINQLKKQIQLLRLQIVGQGGPMPCPGEIEILKREIMEQKQKIRELNLQLSTTLIDKTGLLEKNMILQNSNERLSTKLNSLKKEFDLTFNNISLATDADEIQQNLEKLKDIQSKFADLNSEQKKAQSEIKIHEETFTKQFWNSSDEVNLSESAADILQEQDAHTNKQMALNTELQEITKQLAMKECLANQLMTNTQSLVDYATISANEVKIAQLEEEKNKLMKQLKSVHSHENSGKLAEQRRKQVQELEKQIQDLKKKVTEQARLIKLKEKDDLRIQKLNTEIQQMKSAKVKLIRNMREESDKFRHWKLQRERELAKLKQEDRKKETQIQKIKMLNAKQQNVLKRKVEAAEAVNKRLQHTLALRKQAQDMKHTGKVEKIGAWFKQELDMFVNIVEAEATLTGLLEDRGTLQEQLDALKGNPETAESEECQTIAQDIECRSAQIQDLQQKLLDSDEDNRAKTRFDNIQTMGEAKFALKAAFEQISSITQKQAQTQAKLSEMQDLRTEMKNFKKNYNLTIKTLEEKSADQITEMNKNYEEKIALLLRQLNGVKPDNDDEMLQRFRLQNEQLEEKEKAVSEKNNEIEKLKLEVQQLNHKIGVISKTAQELDQTPQNFKPPKKVKKAPKTPEVSNSDDEKENIPSDDEEEYDPDDPDDPDWRKTPFGKKLITEKRRIMNVKLDFSDGDGSVSNTTANKRSSEGGCTCKTNCKNRCGCRRLNRTCAASCKCNMGDCQNRTSESENDNAPENVGNDDVDSNSKKRRLDEDVFVLVPSIRTRKVSRLVVPEF